MYRKGYRDGMILNYGQFGTGVGGGICQLTNLLYWMVLHTPLTVIERYRHSYDVFPDSNRKQPFGSGATCVYNYRDLQFKNNTNHKYQIKLYIDDHLNGEVLSDSPAANNYEIYQSDHAFIPQYWGGYIRYNVINRKVLSLDGKVLEDQEVCRNHALTMYNPSLPDEQATN